MISDFFVRKDVQPNVQVLMLTGPIRDGQVIPTEFGLFHQGGYTQVTLTIMVGEPSDLIKKLNETAEAVLDQALKTSKPGVAFGDVIDPLEKIVADAGFTHGFPHIHGFDPIALVGPVGNTMGPGPVTYQKTRGADVILRPGMMLSLECGARQDMAHEVRLGGSGVVTKDGFRMFNKLGTKMRRV